MIRVFVCARESVRYVLYGAKNLYPLAMANDDGSRYKYSPRTWLMRGLRRCRHHSHHRHIHDALSSQNGPDCATEHNEWHCGGGYGLSMTAATV